jgi:hypothetical protein
MSAIPKTGRLPVQSEMTPAANPPKRAPRVVAEVMNSCQKGSIVTDEEVFY